LQWPDTSVVATRGEVEDVVDTLIAAGIEGLERGAISQQLNMSVDSVDAVLAALAREDEPRVFWAGYNNAALVASQYWRDWSASVSPRAVQRAAPIDDHVIVPAAPRRWVDIWGDLILPDWHAALKLVLGTITTRPGLTEANLRARVAPFLDRLETADVLQYLVDTGMATRRLAIDTRRPLPPVQATDAAETPFIVWVPDPQFLFSPAEPKVEVAQ
jgi:hypothetical protein